MPLTPSQHLLHEFTMGPTSPGLEGKITEMLADLPEVRILHMHTRRLEGQGAGWDIFMLVEEVEEEADAQSTSSP